MARKKVQLAYIACDTARKSTFKKGLLKKIDELTTLCGVEACAVMYNPYNPEPVVWPEKEKAQKMYDHPSYLKQRVIKATQQLTRLHRYNCEREVALAMYGCLAGRRTLDGLNPLDLHDLGLIVERTIKEISLRLENPRRDSYNTNPNGYSRNDNDNSQKRHHLKLWLKIRLVSWPNHHLLFHLISLG